MDFKYSVIGDNTPENREWLEKIGIIHNSLDDELEANEWLIYNYGMYLSIPAFPKEFVGVSYPHEIDCIGNPQLFRAVTAMSDDSDYMQWFTDRVKWTLCYEENISKWRDIYNFRDKSLIHKATLDELKEHFKTN